MVQPSSRAKLLHVINKKQGIGLKENLQETMDCPIKYGVFPVNVPLNQFIEKCDLTNKHIVLAKPNIKIHGCTNHKL